MQISTSLRLAAAAALLLTYAPLTAQNVGVDVASPVEKLDVLGAIRIGTTSNTNAGTIRYNSPVFQGYDGTQWINFGGGTVTGSGTATRLAFWSGASALSSNANLYWDNTNSRLGIGTATPGAPLHVYQTGSFGGPWFQINNSGNSGDALNATTNGSGSGISAYNNGFGRAATFEINNSSSNRNTIYASTNGIGSTILVDQAGSAGNALKLQTGSSSNSSPTLYSNTFGTGYAGEFRIDNSGSTSAALYASTSGTGPAIEAAGKLKSTTFQMTSSPTVNYVLRSDAAGNATWVNPNTLVTGLLPAGTTTQTLRHDGTNWVANSVMVNNGTNVGIGTTSPDYKLHVSGSDFLTLKLVAPNSPLLKLSSPNYNGGNGAEFWQDNTGDARLNINGTINAIYMKATGDIGLGISFPSVPAARLDVNNGTSTVPIFLARDNGTEVMRIADGGNVGIGTTTPGAKLEVAGQVKITGGTPALNQVLTSDAAGLATWEPAQGDNLGDHTATQNIELTDNWLSNDGGSEGIRVDNTGNVGVGIVPSGSAYLDINGTNAGTTSLQLRSGNTGVGTSSNQITFGYSGAETYRHAIKTRHSSSGNASNAMDFYVWSFDNDAAGTVGTRQVMTIDGGNGGSVGIGTTSPGARLEVLTNGTAGTGALISQFGSTAAAGRIRFYDEGATLGPKIDFNAGNVGQITGGGDIALMPAGNVGVGTTAPGYKLDVNGTTQASTYYVNHGSGNVLEIGDDAWIADVNLGNMIGINGQSTASHGGIRLGSTAYIYSDGSANVGIGSTSPGHPLDVTGTIRASSEVRSGSGTFRSEQRGNFYLALQSDRNMVLYDGAAIWSSGTSVSDIRTKKDIRSLEEVLPTLMSLSAIRFKYKEELNMGDEEHVGVIAQEILKAYPDMVFHDEKSDRYLVYYDKLTTVLLKGIQELQTQVSELKNENTLLKSESTSKINSMQAQIDMITEHLNMKSEK